MAFTGTVDATRGFAAAGPKSAQAGQRRSAGRRRNLWRRAFVRALAARRQAAEREVADFVRLSGLKLPENAGRLRRIVQSRAAS